MLKVYTHTALTALVTVICITIAPQSHAKVEGCPDMSKTGDIPAGWRLIAGEPRPDANGIATVLWDHNLISCIYNTAIFKPYMIARDFPYVEPFTLEQNNWKTNLIFQKGICSTPNDYSVCQFVSNTSSAKK